MIRHINFRHSMNDDNIDMKRKILPHSTLSNLIFFLASGSVQGLF